MQYLTYALAALWGAVHVITALEWPAKLVPLATRIQGALPGDIPKVLKGK